MSKCRPDIRTGGGSGNKLLEKGIKLEEHYERVKSDGVLVRMEEATRYVVLKIPYELLKNDPEIQLIFKDIVHISSEE